MEWAILTKAGPSRRRPLGDAETTKFSESRALMIRCTVDLGKPTRPATSPRLIPLLPSSVRKISAARAITWTPFRSRGLEFFFQKLSHQPALPFGLRLAGTASAARGHAVPIPASIRKILCPFSSPGVAHLHIEPTMDWVRVRLQDGEELRCGSRESSPVRQDLHSPADLRLATAFRNCF